MTPNFTNTAIFYPQRHECCARAPFLRCFQHRQTLSADHLASCETNLNCATWLRDVGFDGGIRKAKVIDNRNADRNSVWRQRCDANNSSSEILLSMVDGAMSEVDVGVDRAIAIPVRWHPRPQKNNRQHHASGRVKRN
ncbi:MAG: hypothetical protein KDJ37_04200 [Hyphomicrobiaceae bacterium]|nr:hypothetical protein [Hyphomicrobiaceae bacterium]